MKKLIAAAVLTATVAGSSSAEGSRYLIGFREGTTPAQRAAALKTLGARQSDDLSEIDALVAEVPPGAATFSAFSENALSLPSVVEVYEDVPRKWIEEAPASFQAAPFVAGLEVRAILASIQAAKPPTRPTFSLPPGIDKNEVPWGIARVNAPNAWAKTMGDGVKVAVIDTGIDCNHPDLKVNCAGGYNAFDASKPTMDDNEHGTHVSGTIAAALDGKGVVGVAPKAKLYAVKVLDKDGSGGLTSIIKGLIWAGNNHMDVANMSLGAPMGTIFMRAAVKYAEVRGVTIVAAAGNDSKAVNYPGAYPEVIAVASLDEREGISDFSSRGRQVQFIAPGETVHSTLPHGGYGDLDGTSMATPHVTGLAALAVARGAHGVDAVRAALRRAAKPVPGLRPEEQGAGVVDAEVLVR